MISFALRSNFRIRRFIFKSEICLSLKVELSHNSNIILCFKHYKCTVVCIMLEQVHIILQNSSKCQDITILQMSTWHSWKLSSLIKEPLLIHGESYSIPLTAFSIREILAAEFFIRYSLWYHRVTICKYMCYNGKIIRYLYHFVHV